MKRRVFYMARPVAGDVDGNLKRALRWLYWLRRSFSSVTFIAPWIADIMSGVDDDDPVQREAGLVNCEAAAARCDAVVLVGGRVSSGMAREQMAAIDAIDLTWLGAEPPTAAPIGRSDPRWDARLWP